MAETRFTEHGAVIHRLADGTIKLRTAEGRRWVFPPNPAPHAATDDG